MAAASAAAPVVLRSLVKGDLSLLVGRTLDELERRAHFVVFRFGDLDLAVNPMLAGRFKLAEPAAKMEAAAAFVLTFQPGPDLRYLDDKKMGKAYLLPAGRMEGHPGDGGRRPRRPVPRLHPRALPRAAARPARPGARVRDGQDARSTASGNAYADEVLFEAGIHPKTWCRVARPRRRGPAPRGDRAP